VSALVRSPDTCILNKWCCRVISDLTTASTVSCPISPAASSPSATKTTANANVQMDLVVMTASLPSAERCQMDRIGLYGLPIPASAKRDGLALTAMSALRTRHAML
jgi:hypothetical protein